MLAAMSNTKMGFSKGRSGFAAALLIALATGGAAHAAEEAAASPWVNLHEGSRVRLLTIPGAAVNAAVEVQLAPGWKTYWRMPGDAGVPPQFDWQGSENTKAIEVLYPAPHRLIEPAAETIGYKGSVVFPVKLAPVEAGKPVNVKLDLEIGICKEICVPAHAEFSAAIPPSSVPSSPPAVVAEALKAVPQTAAAPDAARPSLIDFKPDLAGPEPRLVIKARFPGDPAAADIFIEAPDSIYVPMTKRIGQEGGGTISFESKLSASTAQDLKGKELTITLVGADGATEVRRPAR